MHHGVTSAFGQFIALVGVLKLHCNCTDFLLLKQKFAILSLTERLLALVSADDHVTCLTQDEARQRRKEAERVRKQERSLGLGR